MIKLQRFDLSYFNVRRYFGNDRSNNYLIFLPVFNTFRIPIGNTEAVIADESIMSCSKSKMDS